MAPLERLERALRDRDGVVDLALRAARIAMVIIVEAQVIIVKTLEFRDVVFEDVVFDNI